MMGEDSQFERRGDSDEGERLPASSELRRRLGTGSSSGRRYTQRLAGIRRHSEYLEHVEEEEYGYGGFLEEWSSFMNSGGRAASLCAGCVAFFMSAALMVVAYTAAHCFCAGKDFTESFVGWYIFERSPYWARVVRRPLDIVLQAWALSPRVLLYLCFLAALIFGCLLVLETALAYMANRSARVAAARVRVPSHRLFDAASIFHIVRQPMGEPLDEIFNSSDSSSSKSDSEEEGEAGKSSVLTASNTGVASGIGLHKKNSSQTAAVAVPLGAQQLEGGLLHFVSGLFCSILPGSLLRGLLHLMRRRASADRQAGFTPSAPGCLAQGRAGEVELLVMNGSPLVAPSTCQGGRLQQNEAASWVPPSTCSDPPSSSSAQEVSGRDRHVDDGEDDWPSFIHAAPSAFCRQPEVLDFPCPQVSRF
ncbi:hypothetical protein Esti_000037 [Eimeria stiedai]